MWIGGGGGGEGGNVEHRQSHFYFAELNYTKLNSKDLGLEASHVQHLFSSAAVGRCSVYLCVCVCVYAALRAMRWY